LSNNQITIIVAGWSKGKSYRLIVSRAVVQLALLAMGLVVVGLVISVVMYVRVAAIAGRTEAIASENAKMVERSQRLVALQQEVDRLRSMEAKVLALMGVDTLAADRGRWEELIQDVGVADSMAQQTGGGFVWPVTGVISRGYRLDRTSGPPHLGLDIAGEMGTPIKAADAGLVMFAGVDSIFGNMVIIDHGNSVTSLYGHNSSVLVRVGENVRRGQVIARLGSTGKSSAPHLHFEVREGESRADPLKYLQIH
jgi:murein DD-endopeptidase MepM/ murein hydrolase activator NlpD